MTIPYERLRAIQWGSELLQSLQDDPSIPEDLQQLAKRISTTYPTTAELLDLVDTSATVFPADAGDSIEAARRLFEHLQGMGAGTGQTPRDLLYTMRHFPEAGWSAIATNAARMGMLHRWLGPDLP